jgi:hypothetical protein
MSDLTIGLELVESRTLRSRHLQRADVLDKVKGLATLPGNEFATVKQVAEFYEVSQKTIESVIEDNRTELEANGLRKATRAEIKAFNDSPSRGESPKVNRLTLFGRTAVLNVGMLLKESDVARQVRAYLLTVEATATVEHKAAAVDLMRLQERMDYNTIRNALKLGGAESGDYQMVQNTFYTGLYGKTARQIVATQKQRTGTPRKRGEGFRKSTVAKDFLTEDQLRLLNGAVLATFAQIQVRRDSQPTVAEVLGAVNRAVALVAAPPRIGGVA